MFTLLSLCNYCQMLITYPFSQIVSFFLELMIAFFFICVPSFLCTYFLLFSKSSRRIIKPSRYCFYMIKPDKYSHFCFPGLLVPAAACCSVLWVSLQACCTAIVMELLFIGLPVVDSVSYILCLFLCKLPCSAEACLLVLF